MKNLLVLAIVLVSGLLSAQTTIYVNLDATGANPAGTLADPYSDIAEAIEDVHLGGGGEVLIIGGTYELPGRIDIETAATAATAVTIKPADATPVKISLRSRSAFFFTETSSHITLEGIEIDGNTDENDFWCVVAQDFWSNDGNPDGGGLAVILDGENITIRDCFLHDLYQKAVEIRGGRYVVVEGNIIQNIAQYSLSGGHGIMRQQVGREFFTDDLAGVYRWDIRENMIFNVEQRIYSWVPRKGMIEMVIDEGKSILIDDPKDSDGIQEQMSARIKNNVIAFGAVDHIRLKSTPNLEVSNNSIYSEGENGDGITDKSGDTPTPQFTNFICENNASQTNTSIFAIEIDDCVEQTEMDGGTPVVSGNYAVGKVKPRPLAGLTRLDDADQLFVDPNNGNFTINPALSLPAGLGVDPAILTELSQRATTFGVSIGWDGWVTDNLKLSQTIIDNAPGVNDGIVGNELVFTDFGVMTADYHQIVYQVVDGTWKADRRATDEMDFDLNPAYTAWYEDIATTHLNAAGAEYARIRYGDSDLKQDQVFVSDWLTVSEITDQGNTLINGYDNDFTLDGDLLVKFDGVVPVVGDTYDLMIAATIVAANPAPISPPSVGTNNSSLPTDLFNRVLFAGTTPEEYRLDVVPEGGQQVLRLTIIEALPVEFMSFTAEVIDKQNHLLQWETSYEEANDFFEVERSGTGDAWMGIGRVAAVVNGVNGSHYSFNDLAPVEGLNLYRLRQVDLDGSFAYSGIVRLTGTLGEEVLVYPNPATEQFSVITSASRKELRLINSLGQDVTNLVRITGLENGFRISVYDLSSGVYLLDIGGVVRKVDVRR